MTRDEAIKLLANAFVPYQGREDVSEALVEYPDKWIAVFVDLGILKLDEPKKPEQRFCDVIIAELSVDSPIMADPKGYKSVVANAFLDAISEAGLKIVEK